MFGFQHRAIARILTFGFKILNFKSSPSTLKKLLVSNESRLLSYSLRNKEKLYEPKCKTEMGKNTFECVYSKFINSFVIGRRNLTINHFKNSIFNNINLIFDKTILIFDKFNLKFNCKKYFV